MKPRFNSSLSFTRPNDTVAYSALDVVGTTSGDALVFANIGPTNASMILTAASLRIDVSAIPSGMATMRLHLYSAAPATIGDNATFDLPSGDRSKYLGYIDIGTPIDLGATLWAQNDDLRKAVVLSGSSLYGFLQTTTGYTPTAQSAKTLTLTAIEAQ